jgi:O-antigen ligase
MDFATRTGKFYSIKFRFNIWNRTLSWWTKAPLLGYGIESKDLIIQKILLDHPHNYFLDVLYRGGIAGLSCAIWMLSYIIRGRWKNRTIDNFSAVCFFVLFIIAQFDFYNDQYLFYPLVICIYHSKKMIKNKTALGERVLFTSNGY